MQQADGVVEGLMRGDKEVGLGATAVFGFVRLATSPRVFDKQLPVPDALRAREKEIAVSDPLCPARSRATSKKSHSVCSAS